MVLCHLRNSQFSIEEGNIDSDQEGTQFDSFDNFKNYIEHSKIGDRALCHSIIGLADKLNNLHGFAVRGVKIASASFILLVEVDGRKNLLRLIIPNETITEKFAHDNNDELQSDDSTTGPECLNASFASLKVRKNSLKLPNDDSLSVITDPRCELVISISNYFGDDDSVYNYPEVRHKKTYAFRTAFYKQQWRGFGTEKTKPSNPLCNICSSIKNVSAESLCESEGGSANHVRSKLIPIGDSRKEARHKASARRYSIDSSNESMPLMKYPVNELITLHLFKAEFGDECCSSEISSCVSLL